MGCSSMSENSSDPEFQLNSFFFYIQTLMSVPVRICVTSMHPAPTWRVHTHVNARMVTMETESHVAVSAGFLCSNKHPQCRLYSHM